jgi:hypothetical protein
MVQAGGGPGLAVEAFDSVMAVLLVEAGHLEGDLPAQQGVLGQVDGSHPTLAQPLKDEVTAKVLRQGERGHEPGSRVRQH